MCFFPEPIEFSMETLFLLHLCVLYEHAFDRVFVGFEKASSIEKQHRCFYASEREREWKTIRAFSVAQRPSKVFRREERVRKDNRGRAVPNGLGKMENKRVTTAAAATNLLTALKESL